MASWPTLIYADAGSKVSVSWYVQGKKKIITGTIVKDKMLDVQWDEQQDKSLTYGLWVKPYGKREPADVE
jgi:hypothetical protein